MKKEEFLKKLSKKLAILEESELDDLLKEYEGFIEEKMQAGFTEEEAVKSMGDIDELARELLKAYKVKQPNNKDFFRNFIDTLLDTIEEIIDIFATKDFKDIVKFILELLVIFLAIYLCKIPFYILEMMGNTIFKNLTFGFKIFSNFWTLAIELIYLVFAIIFFVKIFESRYLKKDTKGSQLIKEENVKKTKTVKVKTSEESLTKKNNTLFDFILKIFLILGKFMAFIFLIGIGFYILGMSIVLALIIYLIIKKVYYFGIYLVILALFNLGIAAFILLFKFIAGLKNKLRIFLGSILVNFILLGVGIGFATIDIANTSVSYENNYENMATKEVYLKTEGDLVLPVFVKEDDLIIDNTLTEEIKIAYIYAQDIIDIDVKANIHDYRGFKMLYPSYDINVFNYKKEYLEKFIVSLREKKIVFSDVVGGIKIYGNEETIANLKKITTTYYEKYKNYYQDDYYADYRNEL